MDETEQTPPNLPGQKESTALEALGFLLDYLFARPRFLDGVNAPPLFDRTDFVEHVDVLVNAPAAQWSDEQKAALGWLSGYCEENLKLDE